MTTRADHPLPSPRTPNARSGVTLIELIVVVAAIGLMASVAALAMPRRVVPPDDAPHRVADARARALRTGRPVTVVLQIDSVASIATALPDGSVLADRVARIDQLTGQPLLVAVPARAISR